MGSKVQLSVRICDLADVACLAYLFDEYRQFYMQPTDVEAARVFLEERLAKQQSFLFGAFQPDGVLAGFIQLYPLFSSVRLKPVFVLNDLYVRSSHRRQGVAKQLIRHVQVWAESQRVAGMSLQTAHSNTAAQTLYGELGWERDDEFLTYTMSF